METKTERIPAKKEKKYQLLKLKHHRAFKADTNLTIRL